MVFLNTTFTDTASAWKNSHFALPQTSDFYRIVYLSIAVYVYIDIDFSRWDIGIELYELI